MASIWAADHPSKPSTDTKDTVREIVTQLVISIALGLSAFLGFCVSLTNIPKHERSTDRLPCYSS